MGRARVLATEPQGCMNVELPRRYGLLLVATLLSLGLQGIAPSGDLQRIVVAALSGASLVLAFRAAQLPRLAIRVATGLAVLVVLVTIVKAAGGGVGEGAGRVMNAALRVLGPPAVALGV